VSSACHVVVWPVRYRPGDRLVDRHLDFVRAGAGTLRAVAFDLKALCAIVANDPVAVTAADVFDFLSPQGRRISHRKCT
jgi:hypothetical protein